MLSVLEPFMVPILTALGAGLALLIGKLFAKLASLIQVKVDNAALEGVLLRLNDVVGTVVLELEQTLVKDLKAALADDGKLSAEEKARIKDAAISKIKQLLGQDGLNKLLQVLGLKSPDALLESKIEAAVAGLRGF